jgi:hypothetical protein
MHKSATKCNETVGKWCKNKHGASKIIDTLETYQTPPQASRQFSGAIAGEEVEDFCEGSFRTHTLYFVLSFALLYLFYLHHFIKNPKKLESLVVVISLL